MSDYLARLQECFNRYVPNDLVTSNRYERNDQDWRWELLMGAIDDLTAKVSEVVSEQAAVDKAVTDLVAAINASGSVNDPAIEAAVAQLEAVRTAQVADAAQDPAPAPAPGA